MKKSVFKCSLIAIVCMSLASCSSEVVFNFTLECSEDLLDFVIPTAVYLDEKGVEQTVELSKNLFSKVTVEQDLVGEEKDGKIPIIYEWKKTIRIPGKTAQRDMRVSYRLRDNYPEISEGAEYLMRHHLGSTHVVERGLYPGVSGSSKIQLVFTVIVTDKEIEEYLQNLIKDPDYAIEIAK